MNSKAESTARMNLTNNLDCPSRLANRTTQTNSMHAHPMRSDAVDLRGLQEALMDAGVVANEQELKSLFYQVDTANRGYVTSHQIARAVGHKTLVCMGLRLPQECSPIQFRWAALTPRSVAWQGSPKSLSLAKKKSKFPRLWKLHMKRQAAKRSEQLGTQRRWGHSRPPRTRHIRLHPCSPRLRGRFTLIVPLYCI